MHKKLAADLTSLAHSILQLKNKEDVLALKQKAYEVYEKLAVLAYVEEYINTTPNASETKEELLNKIENAVVEEVETPKEEITKASLDATDEEEVVVEFVVQDTEKHIEIAFEKEIEIEEKPTVVEEILEQPFDALEQTLFSSDNSEKEDIKDVGEKKTLTLEEELDDTISVDVAADLFEKPAEKKSLNDTLQSNIQIGLNDRIAFVKNLFDGSQEDFNRVISQLNTLKTEKEAKKFITKMVKPDYNWDNKEEYEERFLLLIERKFA